MIAAVSTREQWQRRLGPLYGGAVALVHSTPWRWPTEVGDDSRAPGWIVAVGAPIGLVAWMVAAFVRWIGMPSTVASLLGLAMLSLASAAIVERGLSERIARTQTDPTRAAGIVGLVFFTLVRAAAIAALPPDRWLGVLVATSLVGRWAAVFLQALGDPIVDDDTPRSLVATPSPAWLTAALSLGVASVTVLALGKAGIAALAITAALTFALGIDAQRRDHGLSAPVVATAAAIGEVAILLIATIGA
jgi:adenosylcobinamide-GDP ribazoletransferase